MGLASTSLGNAEDSSFLATSCALVRRSVKKQKNKETGYRADLYGLGAYKPLEGLYLAGFLQR